jgi:hypothetical protein
MAALCPRGIPWHYFLLGTEWIPGLLNACKNNWSFENFQGPYQESNFETPKINGTTGVTNSKPLRAVGRRLTPVCVGSHIFVSYVAIIGANYSKKFK